MKDNKKELVQEANIRYHTKLAETYDQTQPYFRLENVVQVRKRIEKFAKITAGKRLLDLGCGTGFIPSLANPYFEEVYGIDITPAMLDMAAVKFSKQKVYNVKLVKASSDKLPFPDSYFDVVTAYSFLHHLSALRPTLKEVFRVLKRGGVFYADQEPNYYFWKSMSSLPTDGKTLSELLEIERKSVCDMVEEVQAVAGDDLDSGTIEMSEYLKSKGGFKEEDIKKILYKLGFKDVSYEYTWYWQEGKVIRDLSLDAAIYFENHLRAALPITKGFFKYVRIESLK